MSQIIDCKGKWPFAEVPIKAVRLSLRISFFKVSSKYVSDKELPQLVMFLLELHYVRHYLPLHLVLFSLCIFVKCCLALLVVKSCANFPCISPKSCFVKPHLTHILRKSYCSSAHVSLIFSGTQAFGNSATRLDSLSSEGGAFCLCTYISSRETAKACGQHPGTHQRSSKNTFGILLFVTFVWLVY